MRTLERSPLILSGWEIPHGHSPIKTPLTYSKGPHLFLCVLPFSFCARTLWLDFPAVSSSEDWSPRQQPRRSHACFLHLISHSPLLCQSCQCVRRIWCVPSIFLLQYSRVLQRQAYPFLSCSLVLLRKGIPWACVLFILSLQRMSCGLNSHHCSVLACILN